MFDIGFTELLLIGVIALVFIGPKRLPELARALGRGYAEFRRATSELKQSFEEEARLDRVRDMREKLNTGEILRPIVTVSSEDLPESPPAAAAQLEAPPAPADARAAEPPRE